MDHLDSLEFEFMFRFISILSRLFESLAKEVQIVYRLFQVNCYLLHVPRLPSQPASNVGGLVIHLTSLNWLDST